MEIYLVRVFLNGNGWKTVTRAFTVEEKPNSYTNSKHRISKDKIMTIQESIIRNDNGRFSFETYCLEGNQYNAENMLKDHIKPMFVKFRDEINEQYELIKDTLT